MTPANKVLGVVSALGLALAGCPQDAYTVTGSVTAQASGSALAGIQVTCQVGEGELVEVRTAGAATEDAGVAEAGSEDAGALEPGQYRCSVPAAGGAASAEVLLVFSDVDGAENGGEFATAEASVEVAPGSEAVLDQALELKP